MTAAHHHPHSGHHGPHDHAAPASSRRLLTALWLTSGFALLEAAGGWWAGSLALLGDAGHMFSDAVALGLAGLAAWMARRPPSQRHSYGLVRAEVIAAFLNGLLMLAVVTGITVEAIARLQAPRPVPGLAVMVIAALGLAVNVLVLWVLSRGSHDLNTRGAMLHVFGDLLGSVAALLAGAVIVFTGWTPIDALLSLVISALILVSTLRLLRESVHVLMEGVPRHLDLATVGQDLAAVPGVVSVHDLHIWSPAAGSVALSAHVVVEDLADWTRTLESLQARLMTRYGIGHATLQPESRTGWMRPEPLVPMPRPDTPHRP